MKILSIEIQLIGPSGASKCFAMPFPYHQGLLEATAAGGIKGFVKAIVAQEHEGNFELEKADQVMAALDELLKDPQALTSLKSAFSRTSISGKSKAKKKKAPRRKISG